MKRRMAFPSHPNRTLLLIWIFLVGLVSGSQRIVTGPSETTVRVGESVTLSCTVADQKGGVQWAKDGFGLGTKRQMELFKRYRMVGSITRGEYNLHIENVTLDDEAAYDCQIGWADHENPIVRSAKAQLRVLAEPKPPHLHGEFRDAIKTEEETNIKIRCISSAGRPAATLLWVVSMDPAGKRIVSYINNASEVLKDEIDLETIRGQKSRVYDVTDEALEGGDGLFTRTSELSFRPTKEDDGKYLTCLALHETFGNKALAAATGMTIHYRPKVRVYIDEEKSELREGGKAVIKCQAEAKPNANMKIHWQGYEGRLIVRKTDPSTAIIDNLQISDHTNTINCIAQNAIGITKAGVQLNVNFGPRIQSESQSRVVQPGETASFTCDAIGNPTPQISWYRRSDSLLDSMKEPIATGNKLTLDSASDWHVGEYVCVAATKGFPTTRLSHYLHLKGPPKVSIAEPSYRKDGVILRCEVRCKPTPNKVIWYHNGREVNYNAEMGRLGLNEVNKEFGLESKLAIGKVSKSDYGFYNCTAWNEFGTHSAVVEVVEQTVWERLRKWIYSVALSIPWYVWAVLLLFAVLSTLFCLIWRVCCCCRSRRSCCSRCRSGSMKPTKFSASDCSDVTVRCEALDGAPHYFTDVFASPRPDSGSEIGRKDYICLPQNNPDMDYLPPPVYGSYYHPGVTGEYSPNGHNSYIPHYEHSVTSYGPSPIVMGSEVCYPVYGGRTPIVQNRQMSHAPMETVPEIRTPDDHAVLIGSPERSSSRVSTHV